MPRQSQTSKRCCLGTLSQSLYREGRTCSLIDEEISRLSAVVSRINQRLTEFFETRTYGNDVQSIFIGVVLMGPGSERLHRVRPLKYRRDYTLVIRELKRKEYLGNV